MRPPNLAVRACTALLLFALFAPTALAAPGRPRFLGRRGSWANGGPRPPMRDEPSPHAVAPQLHQFDRRHLLPRLYPGFAFENATKVLQSAVAGEDTPYDAGTRPGFGQGATPVRAQFRVNNLYDVDPVTSTFTIDVFLRLYWNDPRLIVSPDDFPSPNGSDYRIMGSVALGGGWGPTHAIWTPDIYFANEVDPVTLDEVIKLTPYTGDVFWSRHFVVQLTNSFYLGAFPFDRQVLEMQLTSYSYNENQMAVFWQPETVYPPINPETFSQVTWDYQTYQASREKYYSRQGQPAYDLLKFQMYISRKSGSYYIKSFLPLLLLVALTAVSYWLSVEAVPERLGLSITLVLTIVSFYSSVTAGLPLVNYATTIDWYVFVSFVVAFFSLLEVAIIHHLVKREGNHILATELDFFCRRTVLPFWALFNIAILVQLPQGSFPWLWLLCGILMGLLLIANLWLMAYYTYKRYHVRQELERSVYGREHLEDFGEYVAGSMDIGAPGTFKRRMHDFIVRSTDAAFRFLHLQIPGEAALARLRAEAEGVSKSPTGTEKVAPPPLTERERIDRRSMDADLMRAREAQLVADTMGITGEQFAAENGAEVLRAASGDLRGRRGSILRVNGIEVGVTYGSPRRPSMSGVDRTPSGNLERAPSGNLDRVQSGGTESVVGAAGPESPGLLVPPEMTVTVPTLQRKDTA